MNSEIKGIPAGRVLSIDALRGFDMFWIMNWAHVFREICKYINTPFSLRILGQFDHAEWFGYTFYDFIYPLFLFIVGLSMPFAFARRIEKGDSKKDLYKHIIKRTIILFILGLIYDGLFDFNFSRIDLSGILQIIALSYFFSSLILLNTSVKFQAIVTGILLILYWVLMVFVPVPGYGAGVLTPSGNLSSYLQRYFSLHRLITLASITHTCSTMIGILTGHWLKTSHPGNKKTVYMFLAGLLGVIIGLIWNLNFPISKKLWTSSYVIYSAGWSLILFAIFYWIIDVKGYKKWAFPFFIIGLNPITIYVGQRLFKFGIIVDIFTHGFINYLGPFKPMFYNFCILVTQWMFLYFLYKKKIFLKA